MCVCARACECKCVWFWSSITCQHTPGLEFPSSHCSIANWQKENMNMNMNIGDRQTQTDSLTRYANSIGKRMIHQYPMLMFLSQHLQAHTFYTVISNHDSDLFTLTYFKQYNMNYLKLLLYIHCLSFDVTIKKADLLLVLKQIFHCDPRQHKYEGRTWEWQR